MATKKGDNAHFVFELFIMGCIYILAFAVRLFAVVRYESIIHEFDPWFNFRVTKVLVKEGFYEFHNYFDETTWYPLGRFIGGTVYPGLMWTAAVMYKIANGLHFTVDIRNVCVMLSPFMASNTTIVTYALAKEIWNSSAGVVAAMFIALVPGYISRSVAGSYDNEAVAIFALTFCFFLWCRAVNTGSMMWAGACALGYFYMVAAWGGYIFIINLIPFHVFCLVLAGRYSHRLYTSYCVFYVLGTILSMNISFVSFIPVTSPEHMPAFGVFGLLQVYAVFFWIKSNVSKSHMKYLVSMFVLLLLGVTGAVILASLFGYFPMLTGRLLQLLGSTKNIAIVKSVSEHQPSPWTTFFFDFHCLVVFMPVGIYYAFAKLSDVTVFIVLYVLFSSYFAGIMVRLVLVLAPGACVLGGIGVSQTLLTFMTAAAPAFAVRSQRSDDSDDESDEDVDDDASISSAGTAMTEDTKTSVDDEEEEQPPVKQKHQKKGKKGKGGGNKGKGSSSTSSSSSYSAKPVSPSTLKKDLTKIATAARRSKKKASAAERFFLLEGRALNKAGLNPVVALFVCFGILVILMFYVIHCTWVTSIAYSSPSVILQARNHDGSRTIFDDFREAYYWLKHNTPEDAKIMSWWDYGYQIKGFGNKTIIVDNNTRNNTHIATVGLAMSSTEEDAYPILRRLDVDYVLVVFGGMIGYSSDDINKFLWMVRISGGIFPRIVESDYFSHGSYRVDNLVSKTMRNSLMYKMCYYRFGELHTQYGKPSGFDRVRNCEIGYKGFKLTHLEEAFTTEHWMVRIYRVKKEVDDIGGRLFAKKRDKVAVRKVKSSKADRKAQWKKERTKRRAMWRQTRWKTKRN